MAWSDFCLSESIVSYKNGEANSPESYQISPHIFQEKMPILLTKFFPWTMYFIPKHAQNSPYYYLTC